MFNGVLQRVKLIFILLILPFAISFATVPLTFTSAKKIAFDLFSTHQITLYCGCQNDKEKKVDLTSCNMNTAVPIERARRVE